MVFILLLATLFVGLLIFSLIKGSPYTPMVENLDNIEEYPFKNLYVAGFFLNETRLFKLRGKIGKMLKKETLLLYGKTWYEYYAYLAWSQFLTLALLTGSILLVFAAIAGGSLAGLMVFLTLVGIFFMWKFSILKMGERIKERRDASTEELPEMVSKLALLITSGMVLRDAWWLIAYRKEGHIYDLMQYACDMIKNGKSEAEAIHAFGQLSDSIEIKKFAGLIIQGMEKGNKELAEFLLTQTSELWSIRRQIMLQKGEIAAGKLVAPLGLSFLGVIMIIISATMQGMTFF